MINLDIKYSPEYEISRIKDTLEKLNWFKEKGYRLRFPEGFSVENQNFKDEEYIKKCILEDYTKDNYEEQKAFANKEFDKINTALEKFFNATKIQPQKVYEVYLTKYGVGGSYNLPNRIIINIQTCKEVRLLWTIVHEIVHLSIEDLIQKYNIDHWTKERIVDLTVEKIAPEINTMYKLDIDTSTIDKNFKKYYPNMEKIIENVKN